jgi:hypothetical protein
MSEALEPVAYAFLGIFIWDVTKWVYSTYFKKNKSSAIGVAISPTAQKELDYLHEKTGFTSHKVDADFRFNGFIKIKDNPEAEKIERIMFSFARRGYVFTKNDMLIGNISTITSKEERVKIRRSQFEVIDGFKD